MTCTLFATVNILHNGKPMLDVFWCYGVRARIAFIVPSKILKDDLRN